MKPKTSSAAEESGPFVIIAAIKRKTAELDALDKKLCTEQIAIEKKNIAPVEPPPRGVKPTAEVAADLLKGLVDRAPGSQTPGERLYEIVETRRAIALALEIVISEKSKATIIAAAAVMNESRDAWRGHIRDLAITLAHLRRINRDRISFVDAMTHKAGTQVSPPLHWLGDVFAAGIVGDRAYLFLQAAVEGGFVTLKEIQDA